MLVQSHHDAVEFFPALPLAWTEGSVKGLRARGGFAIDLDWHTTKTARLTSLLGRASRLRYAGDIHVRTLEGQTVAQGNGQVSMETVQGTTYQIAFQ